MNGARATALALALGLLAAACSSSSGSTGGGATTPPAQQMQAIAASVDLYLGAPQRFSVGLVFGDGKLVSFGTVQLRFAYTGTAEEPVAPEPGPEATAAYVPTFGTSDGAGQPPAVTLPSEARGIYVAAGTTFDRAGFWTVDVTAEVTGTGTQTAQTTFAVAEGPALPAPGQPALRTENLTLSSKGAPEAAIDSRFTTEGEIPDPGLHKWTIARAIKEHRPALVVFATPVFCVSKFCGPVTDMVQQLSERYADRAVFIHVEIWRDFQNQVINQAAADWLYRDGDLTEPWLFLIGADGKILDRWSSMWSEDEIAAALAGLPSKYY